MITVHLGHHFFGAGNLGDDLMLAGFLGAVPAGAGITCCAPHGREALRRRFPRVEWLAYEPGARDAAVRAADAWLGLGGSPFQSAVSRWFVDHLAEEAALCGRAGKPMFFLGIGGQDPAAYELAETRRVIAQAERIWTRDARTAEAVVRAGGGGKTAAAADLAHLHFRGTPPPPAQRGRVTATLNFEFGSWSGLEAVLRSIDFGSERVWAAQESRELPGAEKALFKALPEDLRAEWRLAEPGRLAEWPSGEWLLTSRYHATLAGAWAGSGAVVIAINEKLRGVAEETGYPVFEFTDDPRRLRALFDRSSAPSREVLSRQVAAAESACGEFFRELGVSRSQ